MQTVVHKLWGDCAIKRNKNPLEITYNIILFMSFNPKSFDMGHNVSMLK